MSGNSRKKHVRKNEATLDDLETEQGQNMVFGFLGKHKKAVLFIGGFFLLLIIDVILTFMMVFGII